jgi:hypothetical protein
VANLQTLLAQTFPGSPGGMNKALPAWEIDDTECQYLQDGLLDVPGLMRRRGPVQIASGLGALTRKGTGLVETLNPQGLDRYGVLNGADNATGFLSVYDTSFTTLADIPWPHIMPTNPAGGVSTAYRNVALSPGLTGGTWIGVSSAWDANSPVSGLGFWRGAGKVNYTTGTVSVTKGSAVLTGAGTAWAANAEPGMFVYANTDDPYTGAYIGHVLSVNSDTSITLAAPSPYTATSKSYTLTSLRGFGKTVTKGRITCDVSSTTLTGGATKWKSEGVGTGSWDVYKQSDMTWIGKVSSVVTDTTITLAANAAIALTDELYVALRADNWTAGRNIDITESTTRVGWHSAVYAGRQWFANNGSQFEKTYRVWFSDLNNPESVDLTNDGDWVPINSTANLPEPIRAIIPTYNALLVFKDSETFAIYGSSPASFTVKKLEDDGIMSTMAVQSYGGGAIWAGRQGIHFYDGVTVTDLTATKLGKVWKNSVLGIDPTRYRAWSMMVREHYILHIENLQPTIAVVKGNTSVTPTSWTVCINMNTKALSLHTNLSLRGSVILPSQSGRDVWFLFNNSTIATVCDTRYLFDAEGVDTLTADNASAPGPDFFYESKKFNAGDDQLLKRWKQLNVHYLAQGGYLVVDTVLGLNNIGNTLTANFPASVFTWDTVRVVTTTWDAMKAQFGTWANVISGVFVPKRVRFLKKSQHLSFRLYQQNSSMTRVQVGPFKVIWKAMREGRV